MTTYVCPACVHRWKITDDGRFEDVEVLCPNCPPPGQLVAQTFEDCCPEPKEAA